MRHMELTCLKTELPEKQDIIARSGPNQGDKPMEVVTHKIYYLSTYCYQRS